jgi:hypothetical protein
MGLVSPQADAIAARRRSAVDRVAWTPIEESVAPWPAYDPAWTWPDGDQALTAWDLRWGPGLDWPPERQRSTLVRSFRSEWRSSMALRQSVRGWLPDGPEVALREGWESAWVWVGDRILLVRLQPSERLKRVRALVKAR